MAQKPLYKNKKTPQSKVAANRHGKVAKTKKGSLKAAPKKGRLLAAYAESKELTTAINKRNEKNAIGQAANAGGHLKTLNAPPINQTADQKRKKNAAKAHAN